MMLPIFWVRTSFPSGSSVKPEYRVHLGSWICFGSQYRRLGGSNLQGPIVFGIREVSEKRRSSSPVYTLIEHASWDTLNRKSCRVLDSSSEVEGCCGNRRLRGALKLLGSSHAQQQVGTNEKPARSLPAGKHHCRSGLKVDPTAIS